MFTITHVDDDEFIMMDDCCLKQTIQKTIQRVFRKQVTEREAVFICVYQFLFATTMSWVIMQYQLVSRLFEWCASDLMSPIFIMHITLFVNITLIIKMFENIKDLAFLFICKCDFRTHPELESTNE